MRQETLSLSPKFKLEMAIRFLKRVRGKRLYRVHNLESKHTVFIGTREECARYLAVLREKIEKHVNRKRRSRSLNKRAYRADVPDNQRVRA